jgi:hypothetical protein
VTHRVRLTRFNAPPLPKNASLRETGQGKPALGELELETPMLRNDFAWAGGRTK